MRWQVKNTIATETEYLLQESLGVSPLIAQLLSLRGIRTFEEAKSFFRPNLEELHYPFLMKDMDKAVSRILSALEIQENILVYGDYDVDGTTAVALFSSYLRNLGANVQTYIPDRYKEGYGISFLGIDYAKDQDISLIIALDCGIKSIDKIAYANDKNIDFIICDHHQPGEEIPGAVAVLDPKRIDCDYPYKELCGCGVGFKLAQAIASKIQQPFEELLPFLDLVAVAIAADIVPITGENRILAYHGLRILNQRKRAGLNALMQQFALKEFTITDVVFKIAPRINAAGRIEHGNYAVRLLTEFNEMQAKEVARQIDLFNEERKGLDTQITKEAIAQLEASEVNKLFSTVVYQEDWHKGVIGIVASRLIETYYRPTIVFTKSGDVLAASARSVKDFDIYKALDSCKEHLLQFGGHMYAAGMTMLPENLSNFKAAFEEIVKQTILPTSCEEEIAIDLIVDFEEFTEKNLRILKQFEPHGPGNMHPVFLTKDVYDTGTAQTLGKEQEHLKMFVKQHSSKGFPAIGFKKGHLYDKIKNCQPMQIVYSLNENVWKDKVHVQLQIKDISFD